MRILIYSSSLDDLEYFYKIVEVINLDIILDKTTSRKVFLEFYDKYNYDVIFIEYLKNIWDELLNYIINTNPMQKIILSTNKYLCSSENNCLVCQEKHNIGTVIKPLLNSEIVDIFVKDFSCEELNRSEMEFNIIKISKKINSKHNAIYLNIDKLVFEFNKVDESKRIVSLTDLTQELKDLNINYTVTDQLDVKILDKI